MSTEQASSDSGQRRDRIRWSLGVFAIAFALRGLHVVELSGSPLFDLLIGDAASYDTWARRIAGGEWIGGEVFYQAPLYPYFLAVFYATVGEQTIVVRWIQAALGATSCVLLALTGWRLFSKPAGITAGLILACYAPAIFADTTVQKTGLGLFLLCTALWILAGIVDRATPRRCFALGATIAALVLTRENALVFAGVLIPWLLVRAPGKGRQRLVPAALFVVGAGVVLFPVALRNWQVGGGFYLTTSQLGPNLYIGNHPGADGTYTPLIPGRGDARFERSDAMAIARAALGREPTPAEVSDFFVGQVLDYVTAQPGEWIRLVGRKLALAVNAIEVVDSVDLYTHAESSPVLRISIWLLHFGLLAPLALLGVVATRSDRARLSPYYWLALAYGASLLAFYVFGRYRLPLVPFAVLFAAAGLVGLRAFVRRGPRSTVVWTSLAVAVFALLCNWPILAKTYMRSVTHYNLGNELFARGRPTAAMDEFREAIRLQPEHAQAVHNLGAVLAGRGDLAAARANYERALEISPDYADARLNLARTLAETNDPEGAIENFEHGLRLAPQRALVYAELASVYTVVGAHETAIACLERALGIDPSLARIARRLERAQRDRGLHPKGSLRHSAACGAPRDPATAPRSH